jgi:DNA primase
MLHNDFEELKSRISILDIAEKFNIKLLKNHTSKCPFHEEKTGSFKIYPKTNSFYCFGCSCGDLITLTKLLTGLNSKLEAGKYLSEMAGLRFFEELTPQRKRKIHKDIKERAKN